MEDFMTDCSVAAVFSDHCVLQRHKPIAVFGQGPDGATVEVQLMHKDGNVCAHAVSSVVGGVWNAVLMPQEAQEHLCLAVRCDQAGFSKTFSDVAVGEVWFAGGQSNMELELANCIEGPRELQSETDSAVRFYYTQKLQYQDEYFYEQEQKNCWQTWRHGNPETWSAVGYFFAKKLAADLGVTVGIIGCNWGGTSASSWVDRDQLSGDCELASYLVDYEQAVAGRSQEQQRLEYEAFQMRHNEWEARVAGLLKEHPELTHDEAAARVGPFEEDWRGPMCYKNPYRPNGLYQCMVRRVVPYTLKGFLYYQGESDDHKPTLYYKLFCSLIQKWRKDWHDDTLPFVFVQLPQHRYAADRDFKNWCLIREAQFKTFLTVRNTGMVCAADLGAYNDIHPKAKKTLAERMENTALWLAYNRAEAQDVNGPLLMYAIPQDTKMLLLFDYAQDGFVVQPDEETLNHYIELEKSQGNTVSRDFTGFELAGADGVFYPAKFECGAQGIPNAIALYSQKVARPVFARYAWYNYGPITIFGKNGLPLSPFRTQ